MKIPVSFLVFDFLAIELEEMFSNGGEQDNVDNVDGQDSAINTCNDEIENPVVFEYTNQEVEIHGIITLSTI